MFRTFFYFFVDSDYVFACWDVDWAEWDAPCHWKKLFPLFLQNAAPNISPWAQNSHVFEVILNLCSHLKNSMVLLNSCC